MVKVYFESKGSSELAAVFATEEGYDACITGLSALASRLNMDLTESVVDEELNEIEQFEDE